MTKSRGILQKVPVGTRPRWVKENQGKHFCECGCGSAVSLRPEHFPNVPRFVHGHNPVVTHARPKPPNMPCLCGCGLIPMTPGMKWRAGHNSLGRTLSPESRTKLSASQKVNPHRRGVRPPNYKGRVVRKDGYVQIHMPDHPFASKRLVMEHRLVVEDHLRKNEPESPYLVDIDSHLYLSRNLEVHHVNGIKDDNRLENLEVMTTSEHAAHHQALKRAGRHEPCVGETWLSRDGRWLDRPVIVLSVDETHVGVQGPNRATRVKRPAFHERFRLPD